MNSKKNLLYINKFIVKLLAMMKQFPEIINWSEDGTQLEISNLQLFTAQVHPLYFTTSNFKSFLRQLNMYSFTKMSKRKNSITFKHPSFVRGQEHLFETIKRRKSTGKTSESNPTSFSDSLEQSSKQQLTEYQNIPAIIETQIKQSLKEVKEALGGEASELITKLENQIEKLLRIQKQKIVNSPKNGEAPLLQDYLSICKMEEMAKQQYREVLSQQNYEYNIIQHFQ